MRGVFAAQQLACARYLVQRLFNVHIQRIAHRRAQADAHRAPLRQAQQAAVHAKRLRVRQGIQSVAKFRLRQGIAFLQGGFVIHQEGAYIIHMRGIDDFIDKAAVIL